MLTTIRPYNRGTPYASNVCTLTVRRDLCVGCGVCVPVCPTGTLSMIFNPNGELIPEDAGNCRKGCHVCVDACPFLDQPEDENTLAEAQFGRVSEIRHRGETGYYLGLYVGHVGGSLRGVSTSGGLGRWMLARLLAAREVDAVFCVQEDPDPGKRFKYQVVKTPEEALGSAKSAYYPVELSDVIAHAIRHDGRYAVVGLPCFLKGLRFAMLNNKWLRKRIVLTVGLVCGQTKSKFFLEHLVRLVGFSNSADVKASFHEKDPGRPANDQIFRASDGSRAAQTNFLGRYGWVYNSGQFKLNCCNYCDDIFAEVADVAIMDAWLPRYSADPKGTSIVLTRRPEIEEIIEQGRASGDLALEPIPIEDVIESQAAVVEAKRGQLSHRLWVAARDGRTPLIKRVDAAKPSWIQRYRLARQEALRMASFEAMRCQMEAAPTGLDVYDRLIARPEARYKRSLWLHSHIDLYLQAVKRRWRRFCQTGSFGPMPFRRRPSPGEDA